MENFSFNDELIKISGLINNERGLVVDNGFGITNEINSRQLDVDVTYCDSGDFTTLTQYPEDHINAFDVVFCPCALYDLQAENRQLVLEFLVWAMKKNARLVFSVPDINRYAINSNIIWKRKNFLLEEENRFFKLTTSPTWWKPMSFIRRKREYWHKTTVRFPLQLFRTWNSANPSSQWDFDKIAVKRCDGFVFCAIEIKKSINVPIPDGIE